jgi:hypothetical protein
MRKFITILLTIVFVFSVAGTMHAQEGVVLPNPGLTPDSPFYFLDTLGERISLFFARGAEAKAKKALAIAEEKLAEAEVMADEGNEAAAEVAANRYGETISQAAGVLAQAAQSGEGFDEELKSLVTKATSIHLDVLSRIYEKVPKEAQEAIQGAMEKSSQGGEKALEAIDKKEIKEEVQEQVQERLQETEQRLEQLREEGKPIPALPSFGMPEDKEGNGAGGGSVGKPSIEAPAETPGEAPAGSAGKRGR